MCEELVMPAECIVPLPDWMDLDEAVLLEPLSIAMHAVDLSGAKPGCRAAVVGAGPIGLLVTLALSEVRPRQVLVSEPVAARRAKAQALGATAVYDPGQNGAAARVAEASGGADVVFECVGTQEAIDDASQMLGPAGTLVLIGIPEKPGRITYDPHLMRRVEARVMNVRRQVRETDRALALLGRRRDARGVLLTHRYEPGRAGEAFDLVRRKAEGAAKVLLDFG
jgi:threonine dehydrogenase-like Zn-dependent dehydrogenase